MIPAANLLTNVPARQAEEFCETLLAAAAIRIERIVSWGQSSPDGFWYDQPWPEWVLLLEGAARLRFEGEAPLDLSPGSFVAIPAHKRHRVEWTMPETPTIWLAIHYEG